MPDSCSTRIPIIVRATLSARVDHHSYLIAKETATANPGLSVYLPGCWPASDDSATLVRTHGAQSSVRTVGLAANEACSRSWRQRRLASPWSQQQRQPQDEWAAVDILTAAAARRVLPAACAGTDPARLVGTNGTLTRLKRRRQSKSGPGCVALVVEADVLLTADSVRHACTFYGAEAYDAVLHAPLPTPLPRPMRHASHGPASAAQSLKLHDRCLGAGSRHLGFLSMRSLDALATLSLIHAPRFTQKSGDVATCQIDRLLISLLPALGLSVLWLGGSATDSRSRCGMFVAGPACKPTLLAGTVGNEPSHAKHGRQLRKKGERGEPRSMTAAQYGCSAVRLSSNGKCVPLHPTDAADAEQPRRRRRPARVFDSQLWELPNATDGVCNTGNLECVEVRHKKMVVHTPRLVVRPDARNPAAAAIVGAWSAEDASPPSESSSPANGSLATTTHAAASQPVQLLSVHLSGRAGPLALMPLLRSLAKARESSEVEYVYPAEGIAHARPPMRRKKGNKQTSQQQQAEGGAAAEEKDASSVFAPREVPPERRVVRRPVPLAPAAGPSADLAAAAADDDGEEKAGWLSIRWRALAAVLLMVSGWLLLASGARYVLTRWSDAATGAGEAADKKWTPNRDRTAEPLLHSGGGSSPAGNRFLHYVLPKNLRRQLAGGRSRLGDARSTPSSLPLIHEGSRESDGFTSGSESCCSSPKSSACQSPSLSGSGSGGEEQPLTPQLMGSTFSESLKLGAYRSQ